MTIEFDESVVVIAGTNDAHGCCLYLRRFHFLFLC
jgi:hypothetical protein